MNSMLTTKNLAANFSYHSSANQGLARSNIMCPEINTIPAALCIAAWLLITD